MRRTVLLLGKGDLAVKILDWFLARSAWEVCAVVPVQPEPEWTSSLALHAANWGVPVVTDGHNGYLKPVDLAFSVFYDRIVEKDWIDRHERVLNLHNSPLPKYRGVNPINWALRNGESEHGVTIHELTADLDAGPILSQLRFSIWPDIEDVADVYRRALGYGWLLFQHTMPLLDRIEPVPQRWQDATYYTKEDAHMLGDRAGWRREDPA